jgi:hypothetical protein
MSTSDLWWGTPSVGPVLEWFPKQNGPGEIDGEGAKKLLGTPSMDLHDVLIRETAQNSWDARGSAQSIDFSVNLRCLDRTVVETLRRRVFTGTANGTGLTDLLRSNEIWGIEIADRGTVGLGGPIRNDRTTPIGDTNFIDFVFNIGAPRDLLLGAGTYGFGKTIAYVVSGVGAVLIWSRCKTSHGLEFRLIGSAIGSGFDMNGLRYTGRHWWGRVINAENRVEPLVGDRARELGEEVFAAPFDTGHTGTSILILAPKLEEYSPEAYVEQLVEAVRWNLWPKLLAAQDGRCRMRMDVQLNGKSKRLPLIEKDARLSGYARCLQAVREAQIGTTLEDIMGRNQFLEIGEIRSERPDRLLGHLALTRYPVPPKTEESAAHSIALMRNQAELVVRYLERPELGGAGFQWAGVFKPVADRDDSFASAEPPAHDDWVPKGVQDRGQRRDVNIALREVRKAADEFLAPRKPTPVDRVGAPSTAHLGDMLADLLSGLPGPGPTSNSDQGSSQGGGGARSKRTQASIVNLSHSRSDDPGWTRTTIDVQIAGASASSEWIDVSVKVAIEGDTLKDEDQDLIRIIGWLDPSTGVYDPRPQVLTRGSTRQFVYESRADLAIDVQTR